MQNATLDLAGFKFQFLNQQARKPDPLKSHHRILVIEDEEASGLLVEASLKAISKKVRIEWVTTAEEAEALMANTCRFDLIIADQMLEGMRTGMDLWKFCRERYPEVPFIMTSSLELESFSARREEGFDHPLFLRKPFKLADFKTVIQWLWDGDLGTPAAPDETPATPATSDAHANANTPTIAAAAKHPRIHFDLFHVTATLLVGLIGGVLSLLLM